METKNFINRPLTTHQLSEEFIVKSHEMGFCTLDDILQITPEALVNTDGFDYNWLGELVKFLSKNELLHLLQATPGKIGY
jgi:arsenate reductase-like glutaredoxin family protein